MSLNRQVCTFSLADLYIGVDVNDVQEVIRFQEMTSVPLAPDSLRGLINLRGQIVTAIDLRRRLDLPERAPDRQPMNVVVRTQEGPMSLLVDEIGEVLEVNEDTFERPPETLQGKTRHMIRGAYKLNNRLLLALDVGRTTSLNIENTKTQ